MSRPLPFIGFLLICFLCQGQYHDVKKQREFAVVFYNVENLFDTIDDPHKNDNEFLPGSDLNWDNRKYNHKLFHTAQVLGSLDSTCRTGIIGLAEIENIRVLHDLIALPGMKKTEFKIIFEEGNDPRGIDVAILYNKSLVTLILQKAFPATTENHTRMILYAKFLSLTKDTLHVLVNHWKSRSGGQKETEPRRMESARRVKSITDSLFGVNNTAKVVVMGDFNDNPDDPSLAAVLGAMPVEKVIRPHILYNLMWKKSSEGEGSLFYRGWEMFDQIMVSGQLITVTKNHGLAIQPPTGHIFKREWMLRRNKDGIMVPDRATGKQYFGGYSDHLPVFVKVHY